MSVTQANGECHLPFGARTVPRTRVILVGGLIAAALDITYACIVYGPLSFHLSPTEVGGLQRIPEVTFVLGSELRFGFRRDRNVLLQMYRRSRGENRPHGISVPVWIASACEVRPVPH